MLVVRPILHQRAHQHFSISTDAASSRRADSSARAYVYSLLVPEPLPAGGPSVLHSISRSAAGHQALRPLLPLK